MNQSVLCQDQLGCAAFDVLAYDRLAGPLPVAGPQGDSATPDEAAIVCLTRGYADVSRYERLIARNRSIYEWINRHRSTQYPLIIWHEGDICVEHQHYILGRELNASVRFVDVSPCFRRRAGLEKDLLEGWSLGYRLMCRFHIYHVWHYAKQFQYVMRIDEDCILQWLGTEPIRWLRDVGADFGTSIFVAETHALTNCTLQPFVEKYMKITRGPAPRTAPYNQAFPYTNLYVTRTSFWLQSEVQRFLYAVIREPDSIRFRWGDLPVLGIALNTFARPGRVSCIPALAYRHDSHAREVRSGHE